MQFPRVCEHRFTVESKKDTSPKNSTVSYGSYPIKSKRLCCLKINTQDIDTYKIYLSAISGNKYFIISHLFWA